MNQPAPDQPDAPRRDISTGGGTYNEATTTNNGLLNLSGGTARDINSTDNRGATVTNNNYYGQTPPAAPKRTCPSPPPPPDRFAGREGDLATLKAALAGGQGGTTVALTALKGWGGIGKTTLARQLAYEVWSGGEFGAVLWTEVKPGPTAARLLLDWAHRFDPAFGFGGLDEDSAARAVKAGLDDLINETAGPTSRVLVVLDDVWEDGVGAVRVLLKGLPRRAVVLVTTRSAMVAQRLSARSVGLATLPTGEAVALLQQYLDAKKLPQAGLEELATGLGGHALALTLAAKRLNLEEGRAGVALPRHLAEYKKGLASGSLIARLNLGDESSPTDREDSLGLVLSFSYAGLKEVQQGRFRALGALVYDQPFDLRLLAGLWAAPEGAEGDEEAPTADETAHQWANELCNLSLIERAAETELGDGWYRQHPLLHAYALAALKKADPTEYAATRDRYYDRSIAIAEQFDELQPEEWGVLDPYLPHIHGTGDELAARYQAQPTEEATARRALDFARNITGYLFHRQEVHKLGWLEMGLAAAQALQNRQRQSLFLNGLGLYYSNRGDKVKALEYYEQDLIISRELGDRGGEAATLNNMGSVYSALGDKAKALQYYEQALPLRRQVGDRGGEATTLTNMGRVYSALGDKAKALQYYEQALPLFRQVGDRGGEATTLNNMGRVYSDLGDKAKALQYYEQALPLRRQVGDRGGEAATLNNMGRVYSDLGDKAKALQYYEQALPLSRQVGDRGGEATTLTNMGRVYADLGDKAKALQYYEQALPLRRQVGDRGGEANTLSNMGRVYADLGEGFKALQYYEQALPLSRQVGDRSGEAMTCYNIGMIYYNTGRLREAVEWVARCVELDEAVQHPGLASDRATLERWRAELIAQEDRGNKPRGWWQKMFRQS